MNNINIFLRAIAALVVALACVGPAGATPYSSLYVFGDSLSDSGNDAVITGGLIPAPGIYTDGSNSGRFTNGLNYADRLAAGLGLALAPSLSGGGNYAYGGARTDYANATLAALGALSFNEQLDAYYAGHATADAAALYVLWIGANDMADAIAATVAGDSGAVAGSIGTAMSGIGNAIGGLAARGARHFLVPNLPDLSLTPAIRDVGNPGLSGLANLVSQAFNQNLADLLSLSVFSALDIRSLDVFAAQTAITQNPSAFGYTNVTSACYTGDVDGGPRPGGAAPTTCADPDAYMYFDFEHPTAALHAELGRLAMQAVPEPASVPLFLLALVLMRLASPGLAALRPGILKRSRPR